MIILLVLSLALLMFLAYKGVPIVIATLACSIFVLLTNSMGLIEGLTVTYMNGMANFFKAFFLIFLLGALFGQIYETTGAAESISKKIINNLGSKFAMVAVIVATAVLTYGGISVFVVLFCIYPLAINLFRDSSIPKRLLPGAILAGAATFSMTSPFTPSIQNIIPTQYLGTDTTAAAVPGMIAATVLAISVIAYMQYQVKKAQSNNEPFLPVDSEEKLVEIEDKELPSFGLSLVPMIALLILLNVFKLNVIVALASGVILAIGLMWKYIAKLDILWKNVQKATGNATFSIANTCAAVGFGAVVASTEAFQQAIDVVTGIGGNPLISAGIATTALAGIAGSASGGLGIAMPIIADYYIPLGVNPEALHRVVTMACGGLDALPHNGFVITVLVFSGLTHKDSYKDIFTVSVIAPLLALAVLIMMFAILPGWM